MNKEVCKLNPGWKLEWERYSQWQTTDGDLPAAVHVRRAQNRQGKILNFSLNYSSLPQAVNYSHASGGNLLSEASVTHGQSLNLRPWDLAIVEEK